MPQMMPINWIISLILFLLIFILFNILNYYIYNPNKNKINLINYYHQKNYYSIFKWKW